MDKNKQAWIFWGIPMLIMLIVSAGTFLYIITNYAYLNQYGGLGVQVLACITSFGASLSLLRRFLIHKKA
jgi:ABC-type transport system involved in cytochrome c biogenesis permease subunit